MALALCLTLLPTTVFAADGDGSISGGVIGGGETGTGGGGIYVPPGGPTEGGGGTYIPGEDTRTEIWCKSKPDSIGRSYDGTTDGGTIPIDLTFTDGTNEIELKEGTDFTAVKTFDSAKVGNHTVTVKITLIGEAAAKYKLKAGEGTFTIGGNINKAYPDLTVSLSKTTCAVGEKLLPLLSVEGAPEDAEVTYYYAPINSGYLEFEGSEAVPAIDGNTAISVPGTYYVYAKTGGTKNYEEERSTTVELTVNEAVVEAASVTKADGTERTYGSFTDALAAAVESNDSTLQLLYDIDLGDTRDGLSVDSGSFTLDLNGKTLSGEVYNQLLTVSGTADITIKNGKLVNTFSHDSPAMNRGLANAIQITGGTAVLENVEVTSGCGENGEHTGAVCLSDGNLTVANGTFTGAILVMPKTANQHPVLKITSATLHNGIGYFIWNTSNPDYDGVKALFADGSLLFDKDGNYIDITKAEYWESGSSEEESFTATIFAYGKECSVKPHTHTIVNGKCSVCGEVEGDGCIAHAVWSPYADYPEWRTTHIKTMDELREKITSPGTTWLDYDNNATVTFLCDVTVDKTFLIDNYYTNIIIDLNGHTLSGALDGPVITANFTSGTGTIDFKNGKIVNTGSGEAIRLAEGRVTLENVDVTGDLSLTPEFVNSRSYIPTFLGGGSFTKICTVNDAGGWQKLLEDMLPKGYYFADITSGKRVSQTVLNADSPLKNVTVKPCNHKDADGKSTFTYKPERQRYYYCSICGNICPHEHRTELADGKLHCEDCNLTLTAARRDSKNTITYYIDMSDASGNAYQPIIWPLCDQTCTLAAMTYYGSNTIDLNGFTVTASNSSGVLFAPYVSDSKMTLQNSAENQGRYVCEYLKVYSGGTLAIPAENNNLTISAVLIESDGNANLAGGSFGKISVKGEKTLAGLLVSGYYFADTASGEPAAMYDADGNALTELTNVTVQPCSHDTAVCDANGVWKCLCGQNVFVASVTKDGTPTYYTDLQNAFSAADGNTVKLMANVRDVTVSTDKPFTFDLNGYNVYSLTVNNKSTIKDSGTTKGRIGKVTVSDTKVPGLTLGGLLEEGYAFKYGNGYWANDSYLQTTEGSFVTVEKAPIQSVAVYAKDKNNKEVSTIAYGMTGDVTLVSSCKLSETRGEKLSCAWYKLTDDTAIPPLDGATGTSYTLPADLPAGKHTYWVTFTSDDYSKSAEITVTVTPVSLEDAEVTVQSPTYNGVAQNPTATVTLGETVLTGNKDYTVMTTAQTNVGSYTLTVTGKGNYTGKIENVNWKIEPMQLYRFCDIEPVTKVYDGTAVAPIAKSALAFHDANARGASVTLPEDAYDITNARFTMRQGDGTYVESPEAGNGKSLSFTVMLKSGNYVFKGGTADVMDCDYTTDKVDMFTIMQDTISLSGIQFTQYVFNDLAKTYTIDLPALPALDGEKTYGDTQYAVDQSSVKELTQGYNAIQDVGFAVNPDNGKTQLTFHAPAVKNQTEGSVGAIKITVTPTNYKPVTLTVNLRSVNKRKLGMFVSVATDPIVYGMTLGDIKLSADATVDNQVIPGTIAWEAPLTTVPAAGQATYRWTFTPDDTMHYLTASNTITFLVDKATPTGAPAYAAITTGGKTLADAPLTANASWPSGTVQWVDKDGKPLPASTHVQANTEYTWSFTPADAANYNGATGSVTLYAVTSGGGSSSSGGGSSSSTTTKTDTATNPDGSTTKTETKSDGTVVATTTGKDGSVSKTETKKDGSSVTENKAADGSTGTVKTDKNGQTTAETALSSKAIETAKRNGESVTAPIEVEATRNSDTAPTVKIELPRNSGDTKVEIPVSNVKPGTVAVLVHPDGTEEIVKNSLPTEDGIQLTINGGATVKIVDNSKGFIDTQDHWAKDAIDFVSARGLVNGMSATIYAPDTSTTRAQLWTILARQNDADLSGGATWFENAQNWAKEKGISDGANPNGTINRAQMVTMLWRAVGQPAVGGTANFADVPADSYYAQAVAWAVENGITTGVGGGRFDPTATCTRGQIATFLYRLYLSR